MEADCDKTVKTQKHPTLNIRQSLFNKESAHTLLKLITSAKNIYTLNCAISLSVNIFLVHYIKTSYIIIKIAIAVAYEA